MNKNGDYHLCSSVFYHTVILIGKSLGKKFRQKIFPKNGKILNRIQIFMIWAVQELPFHLSYCLFVSLMPGYGGHLAGGLLPCLKILY